MNKWHTEVAIFNTGKQVHYQVEADGLVAAKAEALRQLRKTIPNARNLYLEAKGGRVYTIVSDLYDVGLLSLRCCEETALAEGSVT
ncbi:MAG: hypothetical protein LLF76_09855 [Planctomycetaceae bacterium]|nr:hypothetical protein [Planctomycetaceae bacterium]